MIMEIRIGDVMRLRKPHPCGGSEWTVVRSGAFIGIRCNICLHRVVLDRAVFQRRVKDVVSRARTPGPLSSQEDQGN